MKFKNKNGYIEESSAPFVWALLFGFIYFIYKGIWKHALISFLLLFFTMGLSWLIYPFFASDIVRNNYLKDGWENMESQYEKEHIKGDDPTTPLAITFGILITICVFIYIIVNLNK